jgi:hypothetical protein
MHLLYTTLDKKRQDAVLEITSPQSEKIPGSFEPGIDVIIEHCPILFSSLHRLM